MDRTKAQRLHCTLLTGAIALLFLSGCATPSFESDEPYEIQITEAPVLPAETLVTEPPAARQDRVPALLRIRILTGDIEYYPAPSGPGGVPLKIWPDAQREVYVEPYVRWAIDGLNETGLFSELKNVSESTSAKGQTPDQIALDLRIRNDIDIHAGRMMAKSCLVGPLWGMLGLEPPDVTDHTSTMLLTVRRRDGQRREYRSRCSGSVRFHGDPNPPRRYLAKRVSWRNLVNIQQLMIREADFLAKTITSGNANPGQQSPGAYPSKAAAGLTGNAQE